MPDAHIDDEEVVYRRIPPVMPFYAEPGRITRTNFSLDKRRGELGLSVYRASIVTSHDVLSRPEAIPDSLVASARVKDIRELIGGDGKWLRLDVVIVDDQDNPGHAEIRSPELGVLTASASKALRGLFKLV